MAEARRRFSGDGQHNGNGDAFRHCYWSSLLARDITPEKALQFTTAHEAYWGNPAGEKAMDLHNNGVGIGIGRSYGGASDAVLAEHCATALANGQLRLAP